MNKYYNLLLTLCSVLVFSVAVTAQKSFSPSDYQRADSLTDLFGKSVYHAVQGINWDDNNQYFWYSTCLLYTSRCV